MSQTVAELLVDVLEQPGLLAVERDGVHRCLGRRPAAAQAQARERVAAAAAEARRPVAVGDPDRAEQAVVVERLYHRNAGLLARVVR